MSPLHKYWGDMSPCPIGIDAPGFKSTSEAVIIDCWVPDEIWESVPDRIRPATENAQQPYWLSWKRGTTSSWRLAERRWRRVSTPATK